MARVHCVLSMPEPNSHLFRVRMEVKGAAGDHVDLVMPAWTPGSYKVRDFAKNVQEFAAGRARWEKVDKSRWRVFAKGDVAVEYAVWAFELSVQTSHLDSEHGYVNGASVFFYVDGHKDAPVTLEIRAPRGWRVATGLERRGRVWTAPDYDVLVDCPIEIGTFQRRTFRVRGAPHHLVLHGPANYDEDALVRDVEKIVKAEVAMMRHVPYRDYTFILHNTTERGGGLEHLNSTSLQYPATQYRPREKYENFLELVAHEFFHLWNVKRIRPEMLGPFDYEREVYTGLLWVMEGITSYYDTLMLPRAKLIKPDKYLKRIGERIQKFEEKPGRRRQSLTESSFDTWTKLYQPNENTPNCQMSYYEKGELVGMCLDLEIRRRTRNRRSLDDVMRWLYDMFARRGKGFPEAEFQRACERFADYVDGVADVPWDRFLSAAGVKLEKEPKKPEEGDPARRRKPWLGVTVQKNGAALAVASVIEGSPAWKGGLSARDELVAMDGAKVNPDDWEKRIEDREPGDRMRFTVFRSGFLKEVEVRLGEKENVSWVLRRVKRPTASQKAVYESWLGARWVSSARAVEGKRAKRSGDR
jgi:predicted metalloprotease with PDZ domain